MINMTGGDLSGNVSDYRATAIAYAAIREAELALQGSKPVEVPEFSCEKFDGRLKAAQAICRQYSAIGLGAHADPECRELIVAFISPAKKRGEDKYTGLAAVVDRYRMDDSMPGESRYTREIVAVADIHVLQRLAKRGGKTTLEDFGKALAPVWAWSPTAEKIGVTGSYMIAVEDGLFCADRLPCPGRAASDAAAHRIVVKTFIPHSEMNDINAASWRYLRDSGALRHQPAFPSVEAPDSHQQTVMFQMRAEGGAWEYRRNHARKMQAQQKGLSISTGPELSLF